MSDFKTADKVETSKGILIKNVHCSNMGLSVWRNKYEDTNTKEPFETLTFTLQRSFAKDLENGKTEWKTQSLNCHPADIIKILTLLQDAQKFIFIDKGYPTRDEIQN